MTGAFSKRVRSIWDARARRKAANFPELRNEIVALKKLEQEQKEVALRIARIEEGIKTIEEERQQIARDLAEAIAKLEAEKKPHFFSSAITRRQMPRFANASS